MQGFELIVFVVLKEFYLSYQCHAADRTATRPIRFNLRMHRTLITHPLLIGLYFSVALMAIDNFFCVRDELFWVGFEFIEASCAAKMVFLARERNFLVGAVGIDQHPAYRILYNYFAWR